MSTLAMPTQLSLKLRQSWRQFQLWARRVRLMRKLTPILIACAVLSAFATYGALTRAPTFGGNPETVFVLLNVNIILLLILGAIVLRKIVSLWTARRRGAAGSKMHVRMAVLFSAVAITPAIVMAIFSLLFFTFGVNTWFSERVSTALNESRAVATAYLQEHQKVIRADVLAMANDLNRQSADLLGNPQLLQRAIRTHAALRNFNEVLVFDSSNNVLARAGLTYVLELEPIPQSALEQADQGDVALLVNEEGSRVRALTELDRFVDTYLYVGRYVEPKVLNHIERTEAAVSTYETLQFQRSGLQISFAVVFVIVALLMLIVSVWVGLNLASRLTDPISSLIRAADRVRGGDLSVRIEQEYQTGEEEIGTLTRAFNRMTNQLHSQRTELIDANRQLDDRRRFMEAVLSGVSAGIIGLDEKGRIRYPNDTAGRLLGLDFSRHVGERLVDLVPEFSALFEKNLSIGNEPLGLEQAAAMEMREAQIVIDRRGGTNGQSKELSRDMKTLLARLTTEVRERKVIGYVVTFDDITDLIKVQKTAAWADIARRLAHEIRNPLTPIQLSAERIQRQLSDQDNKKKKPSAQQASKQISDFNSYTEIIIRQVNDLRQMLDEFSSFARMPAPQMDLHDLKRTVSDVITMYRQSYPEIQFSTRFMDEVSKEASIDVLCDARQMRQVFINILKNAVEAIEEKEEKIKGRIEVSFQQHIEDASATTPGILEIGVKDNGKGLPDRPNQDSFEELTDPYVTTRKQGTGLGLAMVKKIMEDHKGRLELANNKRAGALVTLFFHLAEKKDQKDEATDIAMTTKKPKKTKRRPKKELKKEQAA